MTASTVIIVLLSLTVCSSVNVQCGEAPYWFSDTACPPSKYYMYRVQVSATINSLQDSIAMTLLSPANTSIAYGVVTARPEDAGGYDVYVGYNCLPRSNAWDVYTNIGGFVSKSLDIPINSAGTYYIALHSHVASGIAPPSGQTSYCSYRLSKGRLTVEADEAVCGPIEKIAYDEPGVAVCGAQTDLSTTIAEETSNSVAVAVAVPVTIVVLLVIGVVVWRLRKRSTNALRMDKFAAMRRGEPGASASTPVPANDEGDDSD